MVNYIEGFSRPFSDGKKFIIGVILSMIPIVNLLVIGYALRSAEMVLKSKKKSYALPEWNKWGDLFVKGLLSVIIGFIYAIPFLIVYVWFISKIVMGRIFLTSPEQLIALIANNALLILVAFILGIITSIVVPMAIMNYVKYSKFGAAFKFSEVLSKIKSGYILTWIVVMVASVILSGISSFVQLISPIIGFILNGVVIFIIAIITYTLFAEAYAGRF